MENRLILLLLSCLLLCSCGYKGIEVSRVTDESSKSFESVQGSEPSEEISEETSEAVSEEKSAEVSEEVSEETSEESVYVPADDELVLISDYIPSIALDIRYATENNFTKQVIYESADAYLRYGTLKKLADVQAELNSLGYSLLVWDAYRPPSAQWKLWEVCPDPNFVSDPNKGFSGHSRGDTVDITLITLDGKELEMPSGFDEFGDTADRDYGDASEKAAENARLLEDVMEKHGFSGYSKEWWHFSDTVRYEVTE